QTGRLELRRREVERDADKICAEPPNVGRMDRPFERVQARMRIVVRDGTSACWAPAAAEPHPDIRIHLDVANVPGVRPVLGDDPTGRALDVHPDDRPPALAR